MPITKENKITSGAHWYTRSFFVSPPGDPSLTFAILVSVRLRDTGDLAVNAYVNLIGSICTTPEATAQALARDDWDEPALTLLDVVQYWGLHSYEKQPRKIPKELDAALRRFLIDRDLDADGFRVAVEG